jgi:glycosyltransferase involved in cell wall biosynthesis
VSEPKLVSIGIPTYNRARLLAQAIESARQQSYPHLEIIVCDDGSTDATGDQVGRFQDARLRYHRNDRNLRPPANWNQCVRLARGEYFALLPDDDVYYPNFVAEMLAVLERQPALAFAQCAYDVADEHLRLVRPVRPGAAAFMLQGEAALQWQFQRLDCLPAALLFRRAAILAAGLWREDYWDDWAFILRLAYWPGFTYVPLALAINRQHGQNLNRQLARGRRDALADLISQQADVFGWALPASPALVALRAGLDRQLSQHAILSTLGAVRRGDWRLAALQWRRAHQLYALAASDPRWLSLWWRMRAERLRAAQERLAAQSRAPLLSLNPPG